MHSITHYMYALLSAFGTSFEPTRLGLAHLSGLSPPNTDNTGKIICKNGQSSQPYIYAIGDVTHDGQICIYVCIYVVCNYVCMYVCMYVSTYSSTCIYQVHTFNLSSDLMYIRICMYVC